MKKCRILLLTLALLLSLCACGSNEDATEASPAPTAEQTDEAEPTRSASTQMGSGVFETFAAEFVGAELFTAEDGTQALRVYFDFMNLSQNAVAPSERLLCSAVQDGHTLNWANSAADAAVAEEGNLSLRLQPNHSARCVLQYALVSESTVAVLLDDSNGHTVSALVSIGQLPGAPEPMAQDETASDDTLTTDLAADCTLFDLYEASILGGEFTETDAGTVLTVSVDFTNKSNPEEVTPMTILSLSAYQNGVELPVAEDYMPPLDMAATGETIGYEAQFVLRGDDPVLVELYGFREETPSAGVVIAVQ